MEKTQTPDTTSRTYFIETFKKYGYVCLKDGKVCQAKEEERDEYFSKITTPFGEFQCSIRIDGEYTDVPVYFDYDVIQRCPVCGGEFVPSEYLPKWFAEEYFSNVYSAYIGEEYDSEECRNKAVLDKFAKELVRDASVDVPDEVTDALSAIGYKLPRDKGAFLSDHGYVEGVDF